MELFDKAVRELVDPAREPEKIADGFDFTEGPVWNFSEQHLTFVDLAGNAMYRWDAQRGVQTYRDPSGFANGLTYDREGRLLSCEHRARRITRETPDGLETLVDSYQGKKLNAPNDLVVAHDGSIIFTDPHYGLTEGYGGPAEQELPFKGVYRVAPGAEEPDLLVDDFDGPNGLALWLDEETLLVADSEHNHIRRFAVGEGWKLSGGEVLVEIPAEGEGVTDGLKLDRQGNIFSTGPGGMWISSPEGDILGFLKMRDVAANLAWGGADARTLFITASTAVYRLTCETRGHVPYLQHQR
jgi:gluconolactonase